MLVPSYFPALLNPLFPGVPELSVVIYVVKNASRLKSVAFHRLRTGSVFALQLGRIVTLSRGRVKRFLRIWKCKKCAAESKKTALATQKITGALPGFSVKTG